MIKFKTRWYFYEHEELWAFADVASQTPLEAIAHQYIQPFIKNEKFEQNISHIFKQI